MKILTNIQTSELAGIGQTFNNFIRYLKSSGEKVRIVGVELSDEPNSSEHGTVRKLHDKEVFTLRHISGDFPYFGDLIREVDTVDNIRESYSPLIEKYINILKEEKPDLILINGTYFVPWCLYHAGNIMNIPMVLHYHGILTKEVEHYENQYRTLVRQMEVTFDNDKLFYIFPSQLAQKTVENEVFKHKISKSAIISNPIPKYFFDIKTSGNKRDVGYVGRWSKIKNPEFIKKLTRYNNKQKDNFRVSIVSDAYKAKKDLGKAFGQVTIIKPMVNRKLANFYRDMGVVISPSTFETYGNVAQEAIATGTPALVGPNMGIAEVFKEMGLKDMIVDFKSTKKVFEKIKYFSGQSIDDKIKKSMMNRLSPDSINKKLVKILRSV